MRIFIDMDGTLAEWNNVGYEQLFEKGYYSGLKPERVLEDVRALIKNGAPVYILSCYLKESEYALAEKKEWLSKWLPELPEERRIFVPDGTNKAEYLKDNYSPIKKEDILLDDYTKNLNEWTSYGGTGIKYLNGINHTKGTWKGLMLDSTSPEASLKSTLDKAIDTFFYENDFSREIDRTLIGTFPSYSVLKVGDTPQILLDVGCEQLPIFYTQKHLKNAVRPTNKKEHQHGLEIEQIKMLPRLLDEPVMIYDSLKENSIIAVTSEKDRNQNPVIISIKPSGKGFYELKSIHSNFITSVYGRNNFLKQFDKVVNADKLLYINKEKSQSIFANRVEQYYESAANFDFNSIIHKSRNIVKDSGNDFTKNLSHDKNEPETVYAELFDRDSKTQSENTIVDSSGYEELWETLNKGLSTLETEFKNLKAQVFNELSPHQGYTSVEQGKKKEKGTETLPKQKPVKR